MFIFPPLIIAIICACYCIIGQIQHTTSLLHFSVYIHPLQTINCGWYSMNAFCELLGMYLNHKIKLFHLFQTNRNVYFRFPFLEDKQGVILIHYNLLYEGKFIIWFPFRARQQKKSRYEYYIITQKIKCMANTIWEGRRNLSLMIKLLRKILTGCGKEWVKFVLIFVAYFIFETPHTLIFWRPYSNPRQTCAIR